MHMYRQEDRQKDRQEDRQMDGRTDNFATYKNTCDKSGVVKLDFSLGMRRVQHILIIFVLIALLSARPAAQADFVSRRQYFGELCEKGGGFGGGGR